MTWLQLALAIAQIANTLFTFLRERNLIAAGESRAADKAMLVLSDLSRSLAEVDARYDRMSAGEVRAALEREGDFRD